MSNHEPKKPNYNEATYNHEYYANQSSYDRQAAPNYPPVPYYNEIKRQYLSRRRSKRERFYHWGIHRWYYRRCYCIIISS